MPNLIDNGLKVILDLRPQCKKTHRPYAHLSNSRTYYCVKKKLHTGKCEDCKGRQWDEKEPYKVSVPTNKL